jgi:DNA polymerase sigma
MISSSYANVGNHLIQKVLLNCKFTSFMISNEPDHSSCSLIDFFRYYSRDFSYNTGVASIRAGLLKKESKGWQNDVCQSNLTEP